MIQNAEKLAAHNGAEFEANHKMKEDPRITRVGKILRKTSIDEIPQLLKY
jgi:lipopolysaccharide/colanic/teichoic acid biosynthesis glycosyltransferase